MEKKLLVILTLLTTSSCSIKPNYSYSFYESSDDTFTPTIEESSSIEISSEDSSIIDSSSEVLEDETLSYLKTIFGDEVSFYTNDETNPYGVNLNNYGSDVKVIFYEDKIASTEDPYTNVNKTNFYNNYTKASSYEDSYYRTLHGLMSGDITPADYLPVSLQIKEDDKYVRYSTATYVLSTSGEYIAYLENNFDEFNLIYYNGAYTSLNEVAAHMLAFGDVPANSQFSKNSDGKKEAIKVWGEYGRINHSRFSGDTSKYPYEPELPTIKTNVFHETDFGTTGNYSLYNDDLGTIYNQTIYNNGSTITRGAARFVFTYDEDVTRIDDRYVFYTYNHYNDFQEYLNYHDGWGKRFGNESAGNGYCYNKGDYYDSNKYPISKYPETIIKTLH